MNKIYRLTSRGNSSKSQRPGPLVFTTRRALFSLRGTVSLLCDQLRFIKQSLAHIRQRLEKREKQRQANQNWYESLFSWSPWLTTLL